MAVMLDVQELIYRYSGKGKKTEIGPVSFRLETGQSLGIVGESGSGKTSIARLLCRFVPPTSGHLSLEGVSYGDLSDRAFYEKLQYIDQHPYASFHPRRTITSSLTEVCDNYHSGLSKVEKEARIQEVLAAVHLSSAVVDNRPLGISGGECQRAAIARALLVEPQILVCDEITSALDMTIQAEIMELLQALKDHYHMTFVFISHDLALVSQFCDQVLVLKNGQVREQGEVASLLQSPRDAYTCQLIDYYTGGTDDQKN